MAEETQEQADETAKEAGDKVTPGVITGDEVSADKDDTYAWILKGLRRECNAAVRHRPGDEAGDDAGQWFYQLFFTECSLAIRADGLRAYVASVSKLASMPKLCELIGSTRLRDPADLSAEQLRGSLMGSGPTWVRLCEGVAPVPEGAPAFCFPGETSQPLAKESLEGWSQALQLLIDADGFDPDEVAQTRAVAAMPKEIIGRLGPVGEGRDGQDVFGRPLPHKGLPGKPTLGDGVREQGGNLTAEEYGYVFLHEGKLSIVSPIWLEDDKSLAYWLLLDRRPRAVITELVDGWLERLEVSEGVDRKAIDQLINRVSDGPEPGMHVIAQGLPAEDGGDAALEILVDRAPRYGVLRGDGSIDLAKVRFEANVRADQEVARLSAPTPGADGRDLMGNAIPARDGKPLEVKAGNGIRVEEGVRGFVHFCAERDGALKSVPSEIALSDTLVIDTDVGFDTGNLEYAGEIVVKGSVNQGFTVKAGSNVFVFGVVDTGATIVAGGDVVVGQGIVGRRTRVVARGEVRTGFIQEARVRAGGDILVGNHVAQGFVHADGVISVEEHEGPQGGSISGGEVWGLSGIRLHVAGSMQHNRTCLTTGLGPDDAKKLDLLDRKLEESNTHITMLLQRFQLQILDVKSIQQRLAASTGPQKKVLARAAKRVGELVQVRQGMLKERRQIEEGAGVADGDAYVEAQKSVFPGVIVRIGHSAREVKSPMKQSRFQLQGGRMSIR